jgi:hypothetical protein
MKTEQEHKEQINQFNRYANVILEMLTNSIGAHKNNTVILANPLKESTLKRINQFFRKKETYSNETPKEEQTRHIPTYAWRTTNEITTNKNAVHADKIEENIAALIEEEGKLFTEAQNPVNTQEERFEKIIIWAGFTTTKLEAISPFEQNNQTSALALLHLCLVSADSIQPIENIPLTENENENETNRTLLKLQTAIVESRRTNNLTPICQEIIKTFYPKTYENVFEETKKEIAILNKTLIPTKRKKIKNEWILKYENKHFKTKLNFNVNILESETQHNTKRITSITQPLVVRVRKLKNKNKDVTTENEAKIKTHNLEYARKALDKLTHLRNTRTI